VEPLPELAAALRERFPGVEVHEVALGETTGPAPFHRVVPQRGLSGLRRTPLVGKRDAVETITVATARLDDLLPPDRPVALLKIDVEGAELQALRGALGTIRRWRPTVIFEYEPLTAAAYGTTAPMLHAFVVEECGLTVFALDGAGPLSRAGLASLAAAGRTWNFVALPPDRSPFAAPAYEACR
jgi:FkbM family methyltransferase